MVFYESNISEEPVSLAVLGFDVRHCVAAQADVRPNGEFGLTSTQILGENAVTHRACRPVANRRGLAVIEGTLSEQPFEILNTPSKPHVVQAPTFSEPDTATLGLWPPSSFLTASTDDGCQQVAHSGPLRPERSALSDSRPRWRCRHSDV